jgi:hypothetical protein
VYLEGSSKEMTEPTPRCNPSASRNENPILEVLKQFLGRSDKIKVFEVAAGNFHISTLGKIGNMILCR